MQCAAVRKKGSADQCPAHSLKGHTLCGRHARARCATLWADRHASDAPKLQKAQALVRGWLLRKRLHLGGPGVLCRKDLANDEELVTGMEKERQYPLDYFAFEENGKVWWFDFDSLYKWCLRTRIPNNPYTKTPLSSEVMKRLQRAWSYRARWKLPLPQESMIPEERLAGRWNIICQVFTEYGFTDLNPAPFIRMRPADYIHVFRMIHDDLQVTMREGAEKRMYMHICARSWHVIGPTATAHTLQSAFRLMMLLHLPKDPYIMCFNVMSALYRL